MKRFRDFNGNAAYIRVFGNGSARLTIRVKTKLVKAQDYKTEKDARIALGRFGNTFVEIK